MLTDTPKPQAARIAITADNEGNQLTESAQGKTTRIEVFSQSGIGSASIELVSGMPPENIVLWLHLQGLEQFRLSHDGKVVTASVSSNEVENITESVVSSEGEEQSITSDSPYWLEIRIVSEEDPSHIPLEQGYFEVVLPRDILTEPGSSFSFEWIDFYR